MSIEPSPTTSAGAALPRRAFMKIAAALGAAAATAAHGLTLEAAQYMMMPFANGKRRLAGFPQKRELILLRTRAPLLETPMAVFNEGVFTPNDQFYVRWHLPVLPTSVDVGTFRLRIDGHVTKPVEFTLKEILNDFAPTELAAVNQCSGNGRGFFQPRVPGAQWGNGAMGNARWTGVPLKKLLDKAGVKAGAVQVRFGGLDLGAMPETPLFKKSLDMNHASDATVMVAYGMNGKPLPVLNGFPLRLVVPGWYATYWVKALNRIEVLDAPDTGYWMRKAYLIPDTPGADMSPGEDNVRMVPIGLMGPRSLITNLRNGASVPVGRGVPVRGIAFGGNAGLAKVLFSSDGGASWSEAKLERDYGKYSFRRWESRFLAKKAGTHVLIAKAINSDGAEQPMRPNWNPSGFLRGVVEPVAVHAPWRTAS
jgi:DMSO/TMAO reductase YedYZ molybdopterin-dependent catalytic subunit